MKIAILLLSVLLTGCSYTPEIKHRDAIQISTVEKTVAAINNVDPDEKKAMTLPPSPMPTTALHAPAPVPPSTKIPPKTNTKPKPTHKPGIADQLFKASTVFALPSTANISQDIRAQLLVNPVQDLDELGGQITVQGQHVKRKINVSKIIIAKLDAPDFDITSITPTEQAIAETSATEWLWLLRPKRAGHLQVNLSITAVVSVEGKATTHHIKTYDQIVNIEVTAGQVATTWLEKYWQWLMSTLLVPLAVWGWKMKNSGVKKSP